MGGLVNIELHLPGAQGSRPSAGTKRSSRCAGAVVDPVSGRRCLEFRNKTLGFGFVAGQ